MGLGISRRIRGILGVATTWAVAFAGLATVIGFVIGGIAVATGAMPTNVAARIGAVELLAGILRWGLLGAVSGTVFSLAVIRNGRGKTIQDLTPRFRRWGMLAGATGSALVGGATMAAVRLSAQLPAGALPGRLLVVALVALTVFGGVLGGGLAAATAKAASSAPSPVEDYEPVGV